MIQVCSGCATRWNVRDRQRSWCPRCQSPLLPPIATPQTPPPGLGGPVGPPVAGARPPGHPQASVRWIAVRPGAAPPRRHLRRPLSPTPRYSSNPGWGFADYGPAPIPEPAAVAHGASDGAVRAALLATATVLGIAAAVHAVRYLLLVINRETLLPGLVANGALWFGAIVSVAAIIAVIFAGVVLTRWLMARRAGVFAHQGRDETRSARALWAGCLVPVANLFWAPVFLIELAKAEGLHSRLRQQITVWWVLWALSTLAAVFATATSFTTDAQGIADNTVTVTLTYLMALATVFALLRVYDGFVRKPVDRPAHRWIVVGAEQPAPAAGAATAVESPSATSAPAEAEPAESEPPSAVEPSTEGDEEAVAAAPAGRGLAG